MDKPTTPAGPDPSQSPWPEDSGSEQGFGATGIFGSVKAPETSAKAPQPMEGFPASSGMGSDPFGIRPPEAPRLQPVPEARVPAEPVVHKVVFGGGAAESAPELLERMRMASAERAIFTERPPAAEPSSKSSGGFTELFRTMGNEAPPPPAAPRQAPVPEPPRPAQDSGFTSLLRSLGGPEAPAAPPAPVAPVSAWQTPTPAPEPPRPAQDSGFTSLLRSLGGPEAPAAPPALVAPVSAWQTPTPAPEPPRPAQDSGFTSLLRSLGGPEAPAAPPAPIAPVSAWQAPTPAPDPPRPAQDSGFTSLLRSLSSPEAPATPVENPMNTVQPAAQFARYIPEEPRPAPAAPAPGGFTEMFKAMPGAGSEFGGPKTPPQGLGEAPFSGGAAREIPAPSENKPGAFTQLFGTLGSAGATPSSPKPVEPSATSGAGPGSFTQMISIEQRSAPIEPSYREESKPSGGGLDYGAPPGAAEPAASSRDPFSSSPVSEAQPDQSTPLGSGVSVTRLMRMLDEPSKPPAARAEETPQSPTRAAEPGVWTQTFASLKPGEPAAPAKAPEWAPPPPLPAPTGYPVSSAPQYPITVNEPMVAPPLAAPAQSGPSEFTRILDASRMREIAMRGGQRQEFSTPPPPQSFAAPPPTAPQFQPPPPPPGMQGLGGMPQPGGFAPPPPPQAPGYPMQFGAPAAAAPGGSMPKSPGMFAPAVPPMPPAPQPPPVKPAPTGMGKMQQYVPLLLVLVIVLLVVILVTVIFLMKH